MKHPESSHTPAKLEAAVDRLVEIIDLMRKNVADENYPVWKNIPLAREMRDILRDIPPAKGEYIDATGIVVCCDSIFQEELLPRRDCPRLCLDFLKIRQQAQENRTAEDEQFAPGCFLDPQEEEDIRKKLESYIDPSISMEAWMESAGAHLKFDPVERSERWEEIIYEVEKECDRRLKGEPRGMGFCFAYWPVKKAVLAKYGIDWHSPSTMNPRVMFD